MSKVQHTPGPWFIRQAEYAYTDADNIEVRAPDGNDKPWNVAVVCGSCGPGGRTIANAHLTSAAPDLLEALKDAIDCGMVPISSAKDGGANKYSQHVLVADKIRAAVAKAEGGAA